MPASTNRAQQPSKASGPVEPITDPVLSARAAGLRYVSDTKPGIKRKRWRTGFRYIAPDGTPVRDVPTLARIKSLVIPPAWNDVWICSSENGHLQATGRDVKGRKQSRYHPRWREVRDETKYERMLLFADTLPRIRQRVEHDLATPGLPRNKVLATIVRLMETTFIRVGNEEYARENKSYGLTTMRRRHVEIDGSTITFTFQGKSRVHHTIDVRDRRLAKIIKRCHDMPGYELFQYLDSTGTNHSIDSADVNEYLREITNQHVTAKDFRTWAGTVLACMMLQEFEPFESDSQAKKNIVRAIQAVAQRLGNTPSVCRKCYVHPAVLQSYLDGAMLDTIKQRVVDEVSDEAKEEAREIAKEVAREQSHVLRAEESALLQLLQQRLVAQEIR